MTTMAPCVMAIYKSPRLKAAKTRKVNSKMDSILRANLRYNYLTLSYIQDPLSCLRMDDFEIYLRARTYELKLYRTTEKFVTRLKWLPLAKNVDILKESHILLK